MKIINENSFQNTNTKVYQLSPLAPYLVESVSPVSSNITHVHYSLRVVGVDMEDGSIDHSGNICGMNDEWDERMEHEWN